MSLRQLRLPAPAKLNLMLRVVGRRADGYHLLQTVFQFIDLCDWITLSVRNDGHIGLARPLPGVPEESDLTVRAAKLLREEAGDASLGVAIDVEKNLPMGGGLGGGSSDAATTLLGLNVLWSLGFSTERLAELGLRLGADVPVFVRGYAAWGEGVGERLTPLLDLPEPWYVVVVPPCHVATGAVFSSEGLTRDNKPITIADFVAGQQDNHCLPLVTAMYPEVGSALASVARHTQSAKLTGTGACVFGEFVGETEARDAARQLSAEWSVFVAKGINRSPILAIVAGLPAA
ncbi:MAG: 4-(cytidine 5'-diphospho)-2-C-methyl-D-erythritol kinase [Candidatus Methylumidiphilus sp.]